MVFKELGARHNLSTYTNACFIHELGIFIDQQLELVIQCCYSVIVYSQGTIYIVYPPAKYRQKWALQRF